MPRCSADAERLDFTSVHFDPLLALRHEGLLPPVPDAPPLDNLSKFRPLLDPDHPDYIDPANKTQASQPGESRGRLYLAHVVPAISFQRPFLMPCVGR